MAEIITYRELRAQVQHLTQLIGMDGETIRQIGQRAEQNARGGGRRRRPARLPRGGHPDHR